MEVNSCPCGKRTAYDPECRECVAELDTAVRAMDPSQNLFSEPKPERCPAYGKRCECPADSAIRSICERTAANIHR